MAFVVKIDESKCTQCESCVDNCPVGVFEMGDGHAVVANGEDCEGCFTCVEVCEGECITVDED